MKENQNVSAEEQENIEVGHNNKENLPRNIAKRQLKNRQKRKNRIL